MVECAKGRVLFYGCTDAACLTGKHVARPRAPEPRAVAWPRAFGGPGHVMCNVRRLVWEMHGLRVG